MAYTLINTRQGQFAVDWDIVASMVRSYYRAKNLNKHSKEVPQPEESGLPALTFLETNWDKVREKVDIKTWGTMLRMARYSEFSMEPIALSLKEHLAKTRKEMEAFHNWMAKLNGQNQAQIETYTNRYDRIVMGLQFVRDLSASFMIGAATCGTGAVLSTGARAVVGATGAALKTVGKYEDTHNLRSTAIEGSQQVVFTMLPALNGGKEVVAGTAKVIVSIAADSGKALAEGKSVAESGLIGALNLPAGGAGKAAERALRSAAVPLQVKAGLKKVAEEFTKKVGKAGIGGAKTVAGNVQTVIHEVSRRLSSPSSGGIIFSDDLLLKFAIVDMSKGIGRSSW